MACFARRVIYFTDISSWIDVFQAINHANMISKDRQNSIYSLSKDQVWSIQYIKASLSVDDKIYIFIRTRLQREISTLNLLGKRLNTGRNKKLLQVAFTNVYTVFNSTFHTVPSRWKKKYVTILAQRYNYNYQRRRIYSKAVIPESTDSDLVSKSNNVRCGFSFFTETSIDAQVNQPAKSVSRTIIQVNKLSGEATSYRPQDLVGEGKDKTTITMDNLDFNIFIGLVIRDLDYNAPGSIIVYEYAG